MYICTLPAADRMTLMHEHAILSSLLSVVLAPRPDTCGRLQKEKKESCCSVQYVHIHIAFGAHARRIYGAHSSFCSRREKEKRRVLKILSRFFASRYIVVPHHRTTAPPHRVNKFSRHAQRKGRGVERDKERGPAGKATGAGHARAHNKQAAWNARGGSSLRRRKKERNNENTI